MAARVLLLAIAAVSVAGAAAQITGNLNFLAPVMELPGLAKPEPMEAIEAHRRSLLAHGKGRNPAKSKWDARATNRATEQVFVQGVASGDPFARSVILWTRVTVGNQNRPAFLDYAVSTDRQFKKIVTRGTTIATSSTDFTAKVEARQLKPNTRYFYQWRYRQNDRTAPVYSTIGRTRTIPRADEDIARARIGHFGCSNLPTAFFTAYGQAARMAERNEIDYFFHSGDYIYEYRTNGSANILDPQLRASRTHQPEREIVSLSDYRTRHNQYNSDVDTKRMRAAAPLIPVWDDHEYTNNAWIGGAENHDPQDGEGEWDPRRLRALQVYYEMMPIRQANIDNKQQIYRNFEIGKLIKLVLLDTRVIGRDEQNGTAREDPTRSLLGRQQTDYLKSQLSAAQGKQTWKVVAQQVLFIQRCDTNSSDQWSGYQANRREIVDHITSNGIDNIAILTGDIHTHWAAEVVPNACPGSANYAGYNETGQGSIAVEFVSSSITSGYNPNANRTAQAAAVATTKSRNPHVKYFENFYKGFAVLDIRRNYATNTWYFAPNLQVPGQYNTMVQGPSWRVNKGSAKLYQVEPEYD